jgi:flavorubredoxin
MEPDHTGWLESIKKIKEDVTIYITAAGKRMLEAFFGQTENVHVIKDGELLDLGNGRELQFVTIPNVHWPDTMITFDKLSGTMFSCDAFGTFGNVSDDKSYDDQLSDEDFGMYEYEGVRYYSNIVGTFSKFVKKALVKCATLPIKIIAPGHGIVWRKNPSKIIKDYTRYSNYQEGPAKNEITIMWASMYGMTERGVNKIIEELKKYDIKVNIHNVMEVTWGQILTSIWNSTGVIIAAPTYENNMFPPASAVLEEVAKKQVKNRVAFRIGSYGWAGGAEKELHKIMDEFETNWHFLPSVEFKGAPTSQDFEDIEVNIKHMVEKISKLTND